MTALAARSTALLPAVLLSLALLHEGQEGRQLLVRGLRQGPSLCKSMVAARQLAAAAGATGMKAGG